jgi:hypothetical protein
MIRFHGIVCTFPGSASRGLYRVHQFSKVEMFVLSTPEQSEAMLQELCDIEEEIFTELGLHFQMLVSSTHPIHMLWLPGRHLSILTIHYLKE